MNSILMQVKRPYFHVKPLERSQLKNWRTYIDFEAKEGDHERVVVLYERCLIACALYEDMWIRVRFLVELRVENITFPLVSLVY